jgi:hypothetical protein
LTAAAAIFQESSTAFLALAVGYGEMAARLENLERERHKPSLASAPTR